jgi:hypothetical protein
MARKKQISWLKIAGVGVAGLFGMRLYKNAIDNLKNNQPSDTSGAENTGTASGTVGGVASTMTVNTTLGKGSRGEMVALLQKTINSFLPSKYTKLVVDGVFGSKTETALKTFWGVSTASVQYIRDKGVTVAISNYNSLSGTSAGSSAGSLWDSLKNTYYSPGAASDQSPPEEKKWWQYLYFSG